MSSRDKMRCARCTHPRYDHDGTHVQDSEEACTKSLGNGASGRQIRCSCRKFKVVPAGSPDSKLLAEAANG